MDVYFVRHGETPYNKDGKFVGSSDSPLNDYGKEIAAITGKALKDVDFDIAFCSPLTRTKQTAAPIVEGRNIPFILEDRLREVDFGICEGAYIAPAKESKDDPMHEYFAEPQNYIPPEGAESFESLYKRVDEFVKTVLLPLEGKCDKVLVVTHGAVIRSIINTYCGYELKDFWKVFVKNCAVTIMNIKDGKIKITQLSEVYY